MAMSMNTLGQLVGYYTKDSYDGIAYGMVEQPNGTFTNVTPLGCLENTTTVVTGINDSVFGVMGGYCSNSNMQEVAWESYPANVAFSCLGSNVTEAFAVNNWMQMVGTFDAGENYSGFISTDQGTCSVVNYPGATNTVLTGVNDLGAITGYYQIGQGPMQGFILNGSTYTTVNVPGAKWTRLGQVNNNGWFVGSYADSTGQYAFYAMPSGHAGR
jgi:hypothetical protein